MEGAIKKDKENPRLSANPLSILTFFYLLKVFRKGLHNNFKETDLYDTIPNQKSGLLGNRLEKVWKKEMEGKGKFPLHFALLKIFGLRFFISGFLQLLDKFNSIFFLSYGLAGIVDYFETGSKSANTALLYATILSVSLISTGFINHLTMFQLQQIMMKMRIACGSLIYRKLLRMSKNAAGQVNVGNVVNLLSNDVSKFDSRLLSCNNLWISPIATALGTYLIYRLFGSPAIAGTAFLIMLLPVLAFLAKKTSVLRLRTALRTDERVRLMNEVITGMQVIKMHAWEQPFTELVTAARRKEIQPLRTNAYLMGIRYCIKVCAARIPLFITIIAYVLMGNEITAEKVFAVTVIYRVFCPLITKSFTESIISLAEIHISIQRIQTFLDKEEVEPTVKCDASKKEETPPYLHMQNVCARWQSEHEEVALCDINLKVDSSRFVAIIGPVGSGKSTIFDAILHELPLSSGAVEVEGIISYASQESWLFSGTVRENILFGEPMEEQRYRKVIKVCALESDLKILPYGDQSHVGERGNSLSGGQKARINLARAIYKRADIYLLDDPLSAVDTKVGKKLFDQCIQGFLKDKLCILITHQLQYLTHAEEILIMDAGRIVGRGTFQQLQKSALNFAQTLQQFDAKEEESKKESLTRKCSNQMEYTDESPEEKNKEVAQTGSVKGKVYLSYIRAGGGCCTIFAIVAVVVIMQVCDKGSSYWVSHWVNLEQKYNERDRNSTGTVEAVDRNEIMAVYSGIIGGLFVFSLIYSISLYKHFIRVSVNLHDTIFRCISRALMKFFDDNPSGRILNRFSQDLGTLDEYLPGIIDDVVDHVFLLLGTLILTTITDPALLLPTLFVFSLYYILRLVFIRTSRSVKRIERILRSPVYNQVTSSMQGLSTIRAFSAESNLIRQFDDYQDHHSSAWYIFIATNRAFGLWMDLICRAFTACIVFALILLSQKYYGGDIGLIITQHIALTGAIQWGVRQWSEMENYMTSVERILEYGQVERDPVRPAIPLPRFWPSMGQVIFQDVFLQYNADEKPVLNNISFTIEAGEKVGIVGRTGAGKSSTMAALFQLYEIKGSIIIDGVDTTKIPLEQLRASISIIPQEPFLFSGTMRRNLDPFAEYNDEILWSALEQVEMKEEIVELAAGLHCYVAEGGTNFSTGQRQLICLARAIVKRNKILVMDEATANVDARTDALIQQTIRKEFAQCTVITIAHRLHTIMDSDKVLVMDKGRVEEYDHPHVLLEQRGVFYHMVQTTGEASFTNLRKIAAESFRQKELHQDT